MRSYLRWLTTINTFCLIGTTAVSYASLNMPEVVQRTAESQIRKLIEPVLDKYCHDECKLLAVAASVDVATPEHVAPGFDEVESRSAQLAPSSGKIKILINEKVGPVSRSKLLDLIQQYLDTLDYSVKVETQLARFPEPIEAAGKVAELRDRIAKQFKDTLEGLFQQFCPSQCMLADFNLQTEAVNPEEAQYGTPGEFVQEGGVAIRIKDVSANILIDDVLNPQERANILEMAKLKTNSFKRVSLTARALKFPKVMNNENYGEVAIDYVTGRPISRAIASEKSTTEAKRAETTTNTAINKNENSESSTKSESNLKQERFERIERIERVESGDAVQKELHKFKIYGLVFACSILSLLIFIVIASYKPKFNTAPTVQRIFQTLTSDPVSSIGVPTASASEGASSPDARSTLIGKRYECEAIIDELLETYAKHPRVAKAVFGRILTEEGVEITAKYVHIFGESVVMDLLRDPSLQSDLSELMDFYAKTQITFTDDEKLELLRSLHNRTVSGRLAVLGNRSSHLFDFLSEMGATEILELIRNESLTVKAMVLSQCDPQKRAIIYAQIDEDSRLKILAELSRIDHLPRDYIFNVSNALKRKRREDPRLNTETLPGSEVLVSLLERTGIGMQKTVVKSLEVSNPECARTIKTKLVSLDTLRFLRDGQLLEVILSLKHDELLQFLKGSPDQLRHTIFSKSPKELITELEDELASIGAVSREAYQAVERKILNRIKMMANEGLINLMETNERMFSDSSQTSHMEVRASAKETNIKKVAGW
ncbi:MAG: FliG C-terminal domain-containing protein [Bdellovibrionota bacterium]